MIDLKLSWRPHESFSTAVKVIPSPCFPTSFISLFYFSTLKKSEISVPELQHTFLRGIGKKGGLLDLHRWPVKAVRAATLATGERGWGGHCCMVGGRERGTRREEV